MFRMASLALMAGIAAAFGSCVTTDDRDNCDVVCSGDLDDCTLACDDDQDCLLECEDEHDICLGNCDPEENDEEEGGDGTEDHEYSRLSAPVGDLRGRARYNR